jgi:hypothetical protein
VGRQASGWFSDQKSSNIESMVTQIRNSNKNMPVTQEPTKTETVEPKWISLEEAEKLEKFVGKNFVARNNERDAKKFFFTVEAIIPYSPAGIADPDQHRYSFLIQKYNRNKTMKVSIVTKDGGTAEVDRNVKVESHKEINGKWACVDPMANRLVDTDDFKAQFEPDQSMD